MKTSRLRLRDKDGYRHPLLLPTILLCAAAVLATLSAFLWFDPDLFAGGWRSLVDAVPDALER